MRTTCWQYGGGRKSRRRPAAARRHRTVVRPARVVAARRSARWMRSSVGRSTTSSASGALVTSATAAVMSVAPTASAAMRPQPSTLATLGCEDAQVGQPGDVDRRAVGEHRRGVGVALLADRPDAGRAVHVDAHDVDRLARLARLRRRPSRRSCRSRSSSRCRCTARPAGRRSAHRCTRTGGALQRPSGPQPGSWKYVRDTQARDGQSSQPGQLGMQTQMRSGLPQPPSASQR